MEKTVDDILLIAKTLDGQTEAFDTLVEPHLPSLYRTILGIIGLQGIRPLKYGCIK